ncbi:MAG: SDR family oxidoreductase [Anaerolineae bacterium]|nr:MAG: SDR family oxidoreductase [Anaerolineae bacterium]
MQPVAFITGAASGVGKHLAETLLKKHYRLMLTDVREDALREAFTPSGDVHLRQLDIRSADEWQRALDETLEAFGRLDYLFNIAGIVIPSFLTDTSLEDIERQIDTNLKGTIYGTYFAARRMVDQGSGHILNMASLAGVSPVPGMEIYTASKFGVRGFSIAAGITLREHGVYVTVICPDLINTPMLDVQLERPKESALAFASSRPLEVEEVVNAILYAMRKKPLEVTLPLSRGVLAKIGSTFPSLGPFIYRVLRSRGLKRAANMTRARGEAR